MKLKKWDGIRLLRLLIGGAVLIQGIYSKDWMLGFAGVFLCIMPVLHIGCCGVSNCAMTPVNSNTVTKETTYEEIN
jgi:hypothetical protein